VGTAGSCVDKSAHGPLPGGLCDKKFLTSIAGWVGCAISRAKLFPPEKRQSMAVVRELENVAAVHRVKGKSAGRS